MKLQVNLILILFNLKSYTKFHLISASVDFETDNFIQQTIKQEFQEVTVLCIAHRINTIFDYDTILVMDNGKVAEFDTVKNLLSNKSSLFYNLANEIEIKKE